MYGLELSGVGRDGKRGAHNISGFSSIEAAVEKAKQLAATNTFYWGKATHYRVTDNFGRVVQEGSP